VADPRVAEPVDPPDPSAPPHPGWHLPATSVSVPSLRRGLRSVLDETGLPDDQLYDLLLAACEAATNAIEHAQKSTEPFIDVHFEVGDGQVTIVVRDHGQWRDGPGTPLRGRGLAMMRALADTTVDADPEGTTVTMRSRSGEGLPATQDAATA
jgi:anti-sigma regulatory factor (Ser/Thr protein kinase)